MQEADFFKTIKTWPSFELLRRVIILISPLHFCFIYFLSFVNPEWNFGINFFFFYYSKRFLPSPRSRLII